MERENSSERVFLEYLSQEGINNAGVSSIEHLILALRARTGWDREVCEKFVIRFFEHIKISVISGTPVRLKWLGTWERYVKGKTPKFSIRCKISKWLKVNSKGKWIS